MEVPPEAQDQFLVTPLGGGRESICQEYVILSTDTHTERDTAQLDDSRLRIDNSIRDAAR